MGKKNGSGNAKSAAPMTQASYIKNDLSDEHNHRPGSSKQTFHQKTDGLNETENVKK